MDTPLVTVVVPVYNVAPYLETCLKSIQAQTYSHFEVILVNDGSHDESYEICSRFCKSDYRFHCINQKNMGLSKARESGIKLANGNYLTFIDSDDCVTPDFLKSLLTSLIENKTDISICGFYWWYPEKQVKIPETAISPQKIITSALFSELILSVGNGRDMCICGGYLWNKMFKTKDIKRLSTPSTPGAEDEVFLFELLPYVHKISIVNQPLYFYRQRPDSLVNRTKFSFFHVQSRKEIISRTTGTAKKAASIAYIRSVNHLVVEILRGREKNLDIFIEAHKNCQQALSLLKNEPLKNWKNKKDLKHAFLLYFGTLPLNVIKFYYYSRLNLLLAIPFELTFKVRKIIHEYRRPKMPG